MPDLTIEVVEICPMWASNFQVQGSSDNSYLVQFHRYEHPTCSCPAYRFSGDYGHQDCKHLKLVRDNGCFYTGDTDAELKAWNEFNFDNNNIEWLSWDTNCTNTPCPGCGNPMLAVKVAV